MSSSSYQCQITATYCTSAYSASSFVMNVNRCATSTVTSTVVQGWSPDLICSTDGDERVLVWAHWSAESYTKSKLGFFMIPLKSFSDAPYGATSASVTSYFQQKVVFTPKPGLFPIDS